MRASLALRLLLTSLIVLASGAAVVWAQSGVKLDPAQDFESAAPRGASAAGVTLMRNSKAGRRILRDMNMAPGDCSSGSVRIASRVRAPLKVEILGSSDGSALSDQIRLRIFRKGQKRAHPRPAWSGRLSAFGSKKIKHYIPRAGRGYRFEACLSKNSPPSVSGMSTTTDVSWRAVKKKRR